MPQILEVGETNFGGSDEKWEKCKIEPIPCGSECYTSAWKVTTSLGEGDSYKYQVRLFSLTDVGFVDTTDKQLQDFLTGNFVVFWDQEEKIEPGSYLEGGVGWPGGTVLFFNANHEVFGNATGFDMDSHRFKGEYKIDSEKKDKSESVYKIILAGKRVYYVEGEAEAHRSQLSNTELQLLFKDGRVFLSGFSMLDGSEKPLVTLQGLSKKEIDQARASYLKMDSTINEFFSK